MLLAKVGVIVNFINKEVELQRDSENTCKATHRQFHLVFHKYRSKRGILILSGFYFTFLTIATTSNLNGRFVQLMTQGISSIYLTIILHFPIFQTTTLFFIFVTRFLFCLYFLLYHSYYSSPRDQCYCFTPITSLIVL